MIFHEIAVEPEAIRTLRDLQCVLGLAGFGKGRLIADYPHKGPKAASDTGTWAWRVHESVKATEIGKAKQVSELLIKEKKKILKSKRSFHHDAAWIENARKENVRLPFSAMIVDVHPQHVDECNLDGIQGEECPPILRDDQHVSSVHKQPKQFAEELLPMLRHASSLRFVDPHYVYRDSRSNNLKLSRRHANVAKAIADRLSACDIARVPRIVEFHTLLPRDEKAQEVLQIFAREMATFLPIRWKANVFIWSQISGGKRFHARYILTDVGGVGSDYGLDEGKSDGDETDIYLLTESMRAQRTADFSIKGEAFKLAAGPLEFSGTP